MQIVTMPRRFHSLGNISIFSLLQETGYFELHDQISEDDIRTALLCCRECIQEWIQYSEDKRSSSGWYLTLNDEDLYEIAFLDIKGVPNTTNQVRYESAIDACAAFIKHEIESIRCDK